MRTSIDSETLATLEEFTPGNAGASNHAPTIILGRGSAGNDATCEDVAAFEDEAEPWVGQAPARNGTIDRVTGDESPFARPASYKLYLAARANRSLMLGEIIIAVLRAAGAIARQTYARYRQRREARATCDALRSLDDRMLRDLGLDRSEITSVAAEVTGEVARTRTRVLLWSRNLP